MSVTSPASTPVHSFADEAWQQFLELNPLWGTSQGDERWDDRLDDPSAAGRSAEMAMIDGWEERLASLERAGLSVEDEVTIDLVRVVIRRMREAHELRLWEMDPLDQYGGPQALMGDLARLQRVDTPARFERLLARMAAYPAWMAAHRANIADGVRDGRTAAPAVVQRCLTQTRRMVETPADQSPIVVAHPDLAPADRDRLISALEEHVLPAYQAWLAMLEDYQAHARTGDGICHLADGERLYRHHILAWTTLEEDPQSIHDFGLARLTEIEAEAAVIADELGFADVAALRGHLDVAPENHVVEPAGLVTLAEALIERASAEAPKWFGRLPDDECDVTAVEPHMEQEAPPAFYQGPTEDGTRSGRYFINTYDPASRPLHRMAAVAYHEAIPGHHFQIALETEMDALPGFRKFGSRLAGGAFVEGWGLYAERLADEMGLYQTPLERFGALETEAWRAARLVVDTGIHALAWDRVRAIDFMRQRAGLSLLEAETETDRYISWPGQALTYMIGQREILQLRAEIEARDGDRFDHRAFHDAVIGHGTLPLATLRTQLPGWVVPRAE